MMNVKCQMEAALLSALFQIVNQNKSENKKQQQQQQQLKYHGLA